jgi:hypothetical protein
VSFEAYTVGIRLKLIDEVSMGLIGLAGKFSAFNKTVGQSKEELTKLETQLKSIKLLAFAGGAAMAAGIGGLDLLSGPIKAAREYDLVFTKFKTLNLGDTVNAQADQFARGSNLMNVSAKELMGTLAESVGLFGTYAEAQKHAGQLAQLGIANSMLFGGKIDGMDEGSIRGLLKFMDRRGALGGDEKKYQATLNLAEKIVTGSGGFTQFKDLAAFSQMGGTAFRALSDEGIYNMALLLQEQGGARAGTALMSGWQNLMAGRTPVKTMYALADMGLGTIGEIVHGTVGGKQSKSIVLENIKDSQLYQENPTEWYRSTFLPLLAEHGVKDEAGILKWTNLLLSARTASGQASIMDTQTLQAIRDASLAKNAMGADDVIKKVGEDPNSRWNDLSKKYQNMLVELGEAALPLVTKAMGGLLDVIRGITWLAREFPTTTKILVTAFAALAVSAAVGGAIALTAAGIQGLGLALKLGKGLGPMLLESATGVTSFGSALGKLGMVAAAGAAGYAAGTYLNQKFHLDEKIGGFFDHLLNGSYDPNKPAGHSQYVYAGKGGHAVTVHTQINMDGRKVADAVSTHQAMAFKPTGGALFDPSMAVPSVGMNGVF